MLVLVVIALLFGLIIGSFLNNVIFRLRSGQSFVLGHSRCPQCQHQLRWYELVPVFSWLWQRGRCRSCEIHIDKQYPLVELATGVLFALALFIGLRECFALGFALNECSATYYLAVIRDWTVVAFLIIIFIYDLRWQLILDKVTLPAMAVVFFFNLIIIILENIHGLSILSVGKPLAMLLLAAVSGGGFFLLQFYVSKGKWIGGGDIRLGALMGIVLGWPQIVWALIMAYFIGALLSLGLIALGKKTWSSQIPFGTFLSLATIAILFWGEQIIQWYFGILT